MEGAHRSRHRTPRTTLRCNTGEMPITASVSQRSDHVLMPSMRLVCREIKNTGSHWQSIQGVGLRAALSHWSTYKEQLSLPCTDSTVVVRMANVDEVISGNGTLLGMLPQCHFTIFASREYPTLGPILEMLMHLFTSSGSSRE